jgi:hypothetical protein
MENRDLTILHPEFFFSDEKRSRETLSCSMSV